MATVTPDYVEFERLKLDIVNNWFDGNQQQILTAMRRECPVDTGLLKSMHQARRPRRVASGWLILFVGATHYSVFVHQGVGEHVRQVRSMLSGTSRRLQARVVSYTHPGQRANPWMYRALRNLGFNAVWKRGRV